jgi:hypothetical protein
MLLNMDRGPGSVNWVVSAVRPWDSGTDTRCAATRYRAIVHADTLQFHYVHLYASAERRV